MSPHELKRVPRFRVESWFRKMMMEMEERATNKTLSVGPVPTSSSSSEEKRQITRQLALRSNGYKNGFLVKRRTFSNPGRGKEGESG